MKKYKRVFVPNYNYRFSSEHLRDIAEEIVFVCDTPMFDDMVGKENMPKFEFKVSERMASFDPETDIVAFYGDAMIFAMMVMFLVENVTDKVTIARFSSKRDEYIIREIEIEDLSIETEDA